jgi:hypothetical protein
MQAPPQQIPSASAQSASASQTTHGSRRVNSQVPSAQRAEMHGSAT